MHIDRSSSEMAFVSVFVPCRQEGKTIERCLDSIINNNYPKDRIEILVFDGMSTDNTREIISDYAYRFPYIKLFDNPEKTVSFALNKGIGMARGSIIIRMDAHCVYEKNYIRQSVRQLTENKVDNVGGVWNVLPGSNTLMAKAIALAITSYFGAGDSRYRTGVKEARYVDTVPFGAFRKELFDKIGLFDEDLTRGQDTEFNARITKNGGKILLDPKIKSDYIARESLNQLWELYQQYGYFKPYIVKKIGKIFTLRQIVPALFIGSVLLLILLFLISWLPFFLWASSAILVIYIIADIAASLLISIKKGAHYFPVLMVIFPLIHFSFAMGYIRGLLDAFVFKKRSGTKINIPITR